MILRILTVVAPDLTCLETASTPIGVVSEPFPALVSPPFSIALKKGGRIFSAIASISISVTRQVSELGVRRMMNLSNLEKEKKKRVTVSKRTKLVRSNFEATLITGGLTDFYILLSSQLLPKELGRGRKDRREQRRK